MFDYAYKGTRRDNHTLELEIEHLTDLVWYHRCYLDMKAKHEPTNSTADANAFRIRRDFPAYWTAPKTEYGLGALVGRLMALRWARGDEWDNGDT